MTDMLRTAVLNTARGVANEIYSRVAKIKIVDGFETDVGLSVMRGRRTIPGDDEMPCVQVFEAGDEVDDVANKLSYVKLEQAYVIDAWDLCDVDNPNDKAHAMLADLKKVIFANGNRTFDNQVMKVDYVTRDIAPREAGTSNVQARLVIKVIYVEDLSKP